MQINYERLAQRESVSFAQEGHRYYSSNATYLMGCQGFCLCSIIAMAISGGCCSSLAVDSGIG